MQIFSISCTTCGARLKVRDRAAIGQILACPKCGSMVLVEPPEGWTPDPADPAEPPRHSGKLNRRPVQDAPAGVAAKALVGRTFEDAASLVSDEPPVVSPPDRSDGEESAPPAEREAAATAGATEKRWAGEAKSSTDESTADESSATTAQSASSSVPAGDASADEPQSAASSAAAVAAAPLEPVAEPPIMPDARWTSPAAQRWQHSLLLGMAAVVGVALAVGVFAMVASQSSTTEPPPVATTETDDSTPENVVVADPPSDEEPTDAPATDDTDDSGQDTPVDDASPLPTRTPTDEPPAVDQPLADEGGPGPPPATVENSPPGDAPPDLAAPVDARTDSDPATTKPLLDAFDRLGPLIDNVPFEPPTSGSVDITPTDARMGETPPTRPEPRKVDVAARLADEVAAIEFEGVALSDFLQFLTEMSTIPISLDIDALTTADVSPGVLFDLRQSETTLAGLLEEALASLDLGYIVDGGHLVVTQPSEGEGLAEVTYDVADLVDDAQQLDELRELVLRVVAPGSWQAAGGTGTATTNEKSLVVQQSESVHFQVLLLLEKLRVARGRPPRSDRSPLLFRLTPRHARAEAKLAAPFTISFIRPTSLVRILRRIDQLAGVRTIVDWRSAAEVGWSPEVNATLSANNQPLGETLTKLLRPMDLTYRVIDETTLQITTPQTLQRRPELEFYDVGELLGKNVESDVLVQRLRSTLGGRHFQGAGGIGAMHFDGPSQHLLVFLPQPQQKELARLLDHWRAER